MRVAERMRASLGWLYGKCVSEEGSSDNGRCSRGLKRLNEVSKGLEQ